MDAKYGRSGFIHPITTPTGKIITDGYPLPHHSHQHGIFFAWRSATFKGAKLNFWEATEATIHHKKVLEIYNDQTFAGFRVELAHLNGDEKVLHEIWTVKVDADTGHIDFKSEQQCATKNPVILERKHYGGMGVRGSRQWFKSASTSAGKGSKKDEFVETCNIITDQGLSQNNGNHSRPKWVCMSGPVDGAPVSITLIPYPSNLRHPQHVRLHPDMPYFCFTPTVKEPFTIKPVKPLISRYLIVVHDGQPDPQQINTIQKKITPFK